MNKQKQIAGQRQRRKYRVRKRVQGTAERPRLSVLRTHKHVACQLIDDVARRTLVSVSTYEKQLSSEIGYGGNCEAAKRIGQLIAERALEAGIQAARFDRGPYKYHGRVAALAEAVREAGLKL